MWTLVHGKNSSTTPESLDILLRCLETSPGRRPCFGLGLNASWFGLKQLLNSDARRWTGWRTFGTDLMAASRWYQSYGGRGAPFWISSLIAFEKV
ncbi:hypothetical protein DY000_02052681 [Brassica cretica]|uniref:Uncharacterized protein n=1 Tax=Brassica cretica TaxID=69181 RepID=A0ABQ7AFL1_BRACR|nr:hypothetical protein DY000_02052681 [Brassica cretica]